MHLSDYIKSLDNRDDEEYDPEIHGWILPQEYSVRGIFEDNLRHLVCSDKESDESLPDIEVVHRELICPEALDTGDEPDSVATVKFKDRYFQIFYSADSWSAWMGQILEVEPYQEMVTKYREVDVYEPKIAEN